MNERERERERVLRLWSDETLSLHSPFPVHLEHPMKMSGVSHPGQDPRTLGLDAPSGSVRPGARCADGFSPPGYCLD